MLLHIDGSHHQCFQDERWYDLIVILDDATSEIYYAQLTEEESTLTVLAAASQIRRVARETGINRETAALIANDGTVKHRTLHKIDDFLRKGAK